MSDNWGFITMPPHNTLYQYKILKTITRYSYLSFCHTKIITFYTLKDNRGAQLALSGSDVLTEQVLLFCAGAA